MSAKTRFLHALHDVGSLMCVATVCRACIDSRTESSLLLRFLLYIMCCISLAFTKDLEFKTYMVLVVWHFGLNLVLIIHPLWNYCHIRHFQWRKNWLWIYMHKYSYSFLLLHNLLRCISIEDIFKANVLYT